MAAPRSPSSSPPVTVEETTADLEAEHAELDALVAPLAEPGWALATPAPGWAVRDQISHLAFFDEAATRALVDPARFAVEAEALLGAAGDPMEEHLRRGRAVPGAAVLAWWRRARTAMVGAVGGLAPGARVPWFGPPMSPLSFVSARLMETWAHGQDVADALGVARRPTARLRHVAHLGVRARGFSYAVHGRPVPHAPVRVELEGPGGEAWSWDAGADTGDRVQGSALEFCLVVTQRRHVSATGLRVEGEGAREWLAIAQAFAGPPGAGRPPAGGASRPGPGTLRPG
ncbi:MAG TPA: TIGR03084 family metal-binding protein [Acidimicrobiales bacterium]|nr:TIGR03084 family metal-binding protein [Acidimicrobiales bacterium]